MSYSIQCIHCKAVLKSQMPVPAGKKVKCPRCQQMFTTGTEAAAPTLPAPPVPASGPSGALADDDDEMASAIAKLEAEQTFGKKPAPAESKPAPAVQAPPIAPVSAPEGGLSEEDEMAAAIAKLEVEQTFGTKPGPIETKLAPVVETALEATPVPDEDIPEIDGDLVVPDEVGSASEKKRSKNEHKSFSKTKNKGRPDVEDDDAPRSQKRKRSDDDDDEEADERSKKKKGRDDEENEEKERSHKKGRSELDDEEKRSQKKNKDEKHDDVFTDKLQSKKARTRAEDDDDDDPRSKKKGRDDDDEEDDEYRGTKSKKKKKKAGSPLMLIALIGGGILGMFACAACGVGGYFLFLSNPLVGKWEGDLLVVKIEFDFYRGGTGKVTVKNPVGVGIGGAPRNAEETTMHFNYKVTGSNPMILAIEPTKVDANEQRNMFAAKDRPGRLRVTLEGDTMTLVEDEPRGGIAIPITLKRVR
jgi:predicted Zn finger-like uncharacterized protein